MVYLQSYRRFCANGLRCRVAYTLLFLGLLASTSACSGVADKDVAVDDDVEPAEIENPKEDMFSKTIEIKTNLIVRDSSFKA